MARYQSEAVRQQKARLARVRARQFNLRESRRTARLLNRFARAEHRSIRDSQRAFRAEQRAARSQRAAARRIKRLEKQANRNRASRAGEYPRKRNGWLRKNVAFEFDQPTITARIGTNVPWGIVLETGRQGMDRRPWLSRGMKEMTPDIGRILTAGTIG